MTKMTRSKQHLAQHRVSAAFSQGLHAEMNLRRKCPHHVSFLKLRVYLCIALGLLILYISRHSTKSSSRAEMRAYHALMPRLQEEILAHRNSSVAYCIHGLENLFGGYMKMLKSARDVAADSQVPPAHHRSLFPRILTHRKRVSIGPHVVQYLDILSKDYPFVKTVFLERETSKVSVFLNDDYYEPVSNNCSALEKDYKNTTDDLKHLYNATCRQTIFASFDSVPLIERIGALDISMPVGYVQSAFSRIRHWSYLHVLQPASLSPDGAATCRNLTLLPHGCPRVRSLNFFSKHVGEVFTIATPPSRLFYDQLLHELPRLAPHLPFLLHYPEIKIQVGQKSPFYTLLGLPPDRLVQGAVEARTAYVPSSLPCDTPDVMHIQMLSYYLRRNLPNASPERNKIIVMSQYSPFMQYKDQTAILKMLQEQATPRFLEVVEYSEANVADISTIQHLFNEALMVISPGHIPAAPLLFCQPGTVIVESVDNRRNSQLLSYASLSMALGLRYYALYFDRKSSLHHEAADLKIPVEEYLSHVRKLRSGQTEHF